MPFLVEKSGGTINQVVLGATGDGGTRGNTITVGGQNSLPYQVYEGPNPNRAIVSVEIVDKKPEWPATLMEAWGSVMDSPSAWAKKAVEIGAEMIHLKLLSASPDEGGRSIADCVATVKEVLGAVSVPLSVQGCGLDEIDKPLIQAVAEACKGENLLLGLATQDNYATFAAAALANGHSVLANSPLDINLSKQLHILLTEMNLPITRIVMDPSIGGLGYGLEYAYSVLERGRIGALQGDKMLSLPVFGFAGLEAWKAKEANASMDDFPKWGVQVDRGIRWEVVTATSLLQAGMDILVMRHPEALKTVKAHIDELMKEVKA